MELIKRFLKTRDERLILVLWLVAYGILSLVVDLGMLVYYTLGWCIS